MKITRLGDAVLAQHNDRHVLLVGDFIENIPTLYLFAKGLV